MLGARRVALGDVQLALAARDPRAGDVEVRGEEQHVAGRVVAHRAALRRSVCSIDGDAVGVGDCSLRRVLERIDQTVLVHERQRGEPQPLLVLPRKSRMPPGRRRAGPIDEVKPRARAQQLLEDPEQRGRVVVAAEHHRGRDRGELAQRVQRRARSPRRADAPRRRDRRRGRSDRADAPARARAISASTRSWSTRREWL